MTPKNSQTEVMKQGYSNVLTDMTNLISSFSIRWKCVILTLSTAYCTVVYGKFNVKPYIFYYESIYCFILAFEASNYWSADCQLFLSFCFYQ